MFVCGRQGEGLVCAQAGACFVARVTLGDGGAREPPKGLEFFI